MKHRFFPVNIANFLTAIFFYRIPPVHYTFPNFYVMIQFFGRLWVQNRHFHFSCVIDLFSFMTLLESAFHGHSVLVFIPKFLISATFVRFTMPAQALF